MVINSFVTILRAPYGGYNGEKVKKKTTSVTDKISKDMTV